MVNIKGLSKAAVLAALYNNAKTQGMAAISYCPDHVMTDKEAQEIIDDWGDKFYFDYLYGRVLKVDLSFSDSFDERLYDRDNGIGRAQEVIDNLRKKVAE